MTRAYHFKPGNREKVSARMRALQADPAFAEARAKEASRRMKAIHEAARKIFKPV